MPSSSSKWTKKKIGYAHELLLKMDLEKSVLSSRMTMQQYNGRSTKQSGSY